MEIRRAFRFACTVLALGIMVPAAAITTAELKQNFKSPSRDYSTGPLWVWNDMLTDEQIVSTLRDMASQGVKQAFVHPRPGLMTPYLSEEWFRLWGLALEEARRLDMNIWIYDENSYPSGFAGGHVPEEMPESVQQRLVFAEETTPTKPAKETVAIFKMTTGATELITDRVKNGEAFGPGRYLHGRMQKDKPSPWFANRTYVDLLKKGVVEKFIELTYEPYRHRFGSEFGKRIPGVFTDEPHISGAGFAWNEDVQAEFKRRWGYDLLPHLPSLQEKVGDWRRVRHNYWQTLTDMFAERWGRTIYEYCEKYNLDATGHFWDHEWPNVSHNGDNMACYAWQQRPAIDQLMNQYSEDVRAQFGNARMPREVASVANQLGRERTLCETYGAGGWEVRFEDQKRIADWLAVLGINTINQHLSYITLRGARKRDHPLSFTYHAAWWQEYHKVAHYLTRLCYATSQGEQINEVLLLQPTTTAFMYQHGAEEERSRIGNSFQQLVIALERAQAEYDIGSEYVIGLHGSVNGKALKVGERSYKLVLIPAATENLNTTTAKLLAEFAAAGGAVRYCGDAPSMVDGKAQAEVLPAVANVRKAAESEAVAEAAALNAASFSVAREAGDKGILFHQRRKLADGEVLLLVNTSIDQPARGKWFSNMKGAELLDLEAGEVRAALFDSSTTGISGAFDIPPCGSELVLLSSSPRDPAPAKRPSTRNIAATGPPQIKRLDPNVLVLDYVDLKAGGENFARHYYYKAGQIAFQKNGMERNPWDSAVQYKDELITKTFPPESGFEATYTFHLADDAPTSLSLVLERPDLYSITCNGTSVTATPGDWWLDHAFGVISLKGKTRPGENRVTIAARPFTIYHELESAYLLGDFALETSASGFLVRAPRDILLGGWNEQGHPFYSGRVSYTEKFNVADPTKNQYFAELAKWHGAVAQVIVNGKPADSIGWAPWHSEVTKMLRPGENTVEVIVIATPRNLLGPHHFKHRGSAWPGMFHNGPDNGPPPGKDYDSIAYGLMEPFALVEQMGQE